MADSPSACCYSVLLRPNGLAVLSFKAAPFQMFVRTAHYFSPHRGAKGGVWGGRQLCCRLPPRLHSENGFMAEAPLEGAGAT